MGKLTPDERKQLAREAALERWRKAKARQVVLSAGILEPGEKQPTDAAVAKALPMIPKDLPVAKWPGELEVGVACYVLDEAALESYRESKQLP